MAENSEARKRQEERDTARAKQLYFEELTSYNWRVERLHTVQMAALLLIGFFLGIGVAERNWRYAVVAFAIVGLVQIAEWAVKKTKPELPRGMF